eukprot:4792313-Amphidinium_carterae.1
MGSHHMNFSGVSNIKDTSFNLERRPWQQWRYIRTRKGTSECKNNASTGHGLGKTHQPTSIL